MHRRNFLQLATVASACAATPTDLPKYKVVSAFSPSPNPGMPGPYPGKAVRVHSEKSVDTATHKINDAKVREHLSAEEIARLMDPKNYIGSATEMAKKVLSTLDRKL